MRLGKRILSEFLRGVLLIVGVSLMAFILITKAPIDPLTSYIGENSTLSQETKDKISEYWGFDDPLPERFANWAGRALKGDLGESVTYKRPVMEVIRERMMYSFALMLLAWVFSGVLGFLIGIVCGLHPGSLFDRVMKVFCLSMRCAPPFWLGLLFLTLFAVKLGWFPLGMAVPMGKLAADVTLGDRLFHLVLPTLTLTVANINEVVLYTRQELIETMNSDYILYARARGESTWQLVRRHLMRNIALPAITVHFASFSELFGGMALAENVFSYPGIGTATTAAAMNADVPMLLGIALFSALFVFAGNLIANVLYGIFDPRLKEADHA